jgi:hypothetical protein
VREGIAFEPWADIPDGCDSGTRCECGWSGRDGRRGSFFNSMIRLVFLDWRFLRSRLQSESHTCLRLRFLRALCLSNRLESKRLLRAAIWSVLLLLLLLLELFLFFDWIQNQPLLHGIGIAGEEWGLPG